MSTWEVLMSLTWWWPCIAPQRSPTGGTFLTYRWYHQWMAAVLPRFQRNCAKAQKAQGVQVGGCGCPYPWLKEEGKALQGKRRGCAQFLQTTTDNFKTSGWCPLWSSGSLPSLYWQGKGRDKILSRGTDNSLNNGVHLCIVKKGKAHETTSNGSAKSEYRQK